MKFSKEVWNNVHFTIECSSIVKSFNSSFIYKLFVEKNNLFTYKKMHRYL